MRRVICYIYIQSSKKEIIGLDLYEKYKDGIDITVYDPLLIALKKLKEEYENE